jgi:hypothetical protein
MSKKRPDTTTITNELEGASLFFAKPQDAPPPDEPISQETPAEPAPEKVELPAPSNNHDIKQPRNRGITTPRYHGAMIEQVRKAVKEFGKEAATHRFTLDEKRAIADLLYAYERCGLRTNENEVTRVAINFILNDYGEHGENSILHRVLTALNR